MGLLDDLKHKAEELGEKAKDGLEDAKDRAGDLLGDAKDKAGDLLGDAKERASGLVDDVQERLHHHDEGSPLRESSDIAPDDDEADEAGAATGAVGPSAEDSVDEPAVESDVDPYDAPLTETIGDEIADDDVDPQAVADSVDRPQGQG